jgi:superfamily II DNA helicase RecQ
MQIKLFQIYAGDTDCLEEMNKFLRGGDKILKIDKSFDSAGLCWHYSVEYIGKTVPSFKSAAANALIPELDANTQMRFSLLKDARRQIAQEDNIIQNFSVFYNKELENIASLPEMTLEAIKGIAGIRRKQVEEYGDRLLKHFADLGGEQKKEIVETVETAETETFPPLQPLSEITSDLF